jgi:hypothetical protein
LWFAVSQNMNSQKTCQNFWDGVLLENKIENVDFRKKTLRKVALRTFELFKK